MLSGNYLSEEQCENMKKYRYKGGDEGLMYIYFYNPVASRTVELLPDWLAPNAITLIGFIFSALPFCVLFGFYGTKFENDPENPVPNWFFFLEAFCYFMYRFMDECDGKQARRTGNSSPLGLLFDHGCDSISIGL